jgi:hypothetical protein
LIGSGRSNDEAPRGSRGALRFSSADGWSALPYDRYAPSKERSIVTTAHRSSSRRVPRDGGRAGFNRFITRRTLMRKVRLDIDNLQVESFETASAAGGRGTVRGLGFVVGVGTVEPVSGQCGSYPNCPSPLCVDTPLASCDNASCHASCGDSCNGTCQSCATCNSCQESCLGTCGACIPPDPIQGVIR